MARTGKVNKRERIVVIDGRRGGVGSKVVGGNEWAPFLNIVGICSGCLNLGLKGSNLIFLLLCTN